MNIYVGNLSRDLNEGELRQAFAAFGDIASASIIKEKFSGETRGFGFVEMPNKDEAEKPPPARIFEQVALMAAASAVLIDDPPAAIPAPGF